jgi:hypothetical protein
MTYTTPRLSHEHCGHLGFCLEVITMGFEFALMHSLGEHHPRAVDSPS